MSVCPPLLPPSLPLVALYVFSFARRSTVWPRLPLTQAFLWLQLINTGSCGPLSDVGSANWNQQQSMVSKNEHLCVCVLDWWMKMMENLPHSHGDHPVIKLLSRPLGFFFFFFCKISERNCSAVMSAGWQHDESSLKIMHACMHAKKKSWCPH